MKQTLPYPVTWLQMRQWGVRHPQFAAAMLAAPPIEVDEAFLEPNAQPMELQEIAHGMYLYLLDTPGGLDTHTFLTEEGRPDVAAAAHFKQRVWDDFLALMPVAHTVSVVQEGHRVHLVLDYIQVVEPNGRHLIEQRLAGRR